MPRMGRPSACAPPSTNGRRLSNGWRKSSKLTVSAGETIVYDTRKPYVFGFVSTVRQLLIDLPAPINHFLKLRFCGRPSSAQKKAANISKT